MTRLELIAEICKRMAQELKEDNDRADEKELMDDKELSFNPHNMKLNQDEIY